MSQLIVMINSNQPTLPHEEMYKSPDIAQNQPNATSLRDNLSLLAKVFGYAEYNYLDFNDIIRSAAQQLEDAKQETVRRAYLRRILETEGGVYISVIKTGRLGSEPVISDELRFAEDTSLLLTKLGVFYIASVGQGNSRSFGLYELPVAQHPDHNALIFPFEVRDPMQTDKRMLGREFCVLCVFFEKRFEELFNNRNKLSSAISMIVKTRHNMHELDALFLQQVRHVVLNAC